MFWKNWSWPTRILLGAGLGLVAFGFWFMSAVNNSMRLNEHYGSCHSNLKQIGLGFAQYTQDYDERLPPSASGGATFGWADALQPYLRSTQLFQCPVEANQGQTDSHLTGYTDYWFNARLSKRELKTIDEPARLIAAGDGNDGTDLTDARYSISALPSQWISDTNSPLYRHFEAANYLFADGHVKAMQPTSIANQWSRTHPSFEPEQAR